MERGEKKNKAQGENYVNKQDKMHLEAKGNEDVLERRDKRGRNAVMSTDVEGSLQRMWLTTFAFAQLYVGGQKHPETLKEFEMFKGSVNTECLLKTNNTGWVISGCYIFWAARGSV